MQNVLYCAFCPCSKVLEVLNHLQHLTIFGLLLVDPG